jgi:hypothetical protein
VAWSGERRIHVQYNIEVPTGPTERKISWLSAKRVSNLECFLGLSRNQVGFVADAICSRSLQIFRTDKLTSTSIFVYTTQHVLHELFHISSRFVGVRIAVVSPLALHIK